jgi:hypothetical protein
LVLLVTEAAQRFVREKLNFDEWLWLDRRFAVNYLAAGPLTEDLQDEGFLVVTKH